MSISELFNSNPLYSANLGKQPNTIQLNLSKKNINSKGIEILMSNLKEQNTQVKSFHLQLNDNSIGDKGLMVLISNLNDWLNLEHLSLFLSQNRFSKDGSKSLASMKTHPKLISLTLALSKNDVGEELAKNVATLISKQTDLKQLILVMNECGIGNNGLKAICQQIRDLKKLEKVSLFFDENSITNNGALDAVKLICNNKNIKSLNLEICNVKIHEYDQQDQYNLYYNVISQKCLKQMIELIGANLNLDQLVLNAYYYDDNSYLEFQKCGYEGLERDFIMETSIIQQTIEQNLQNIPSKRIVF